MNLKRIVIAVLVSVLLVGYIAVGIVSADCCDIDEDCCCEEKKGKTLDEWGCVCINGALADGWCTYIDEAEV